MTSPEGYMYKGSMSVYFFDQYIFKLKTPVKIAMYSEPKATNTYLNNKKIVINVKYTNDAFWDVFQYAFVEGKPYNWQQIRNGDKYVVISEDTRRKYFGDNKQVVGKYIETDNVQYRIIGVIKNVPITLRYNYADAFLPYTISKVGITGKTYDGIFNATLLAARKEDLPNIQREYQQMLAKVQMNDGIYNQIRSYADPYLTVFTRQSVPDNDNSGNSGAGKILTIAGTLFLLFLLLPTLNLVNINISRIAERSSEIGVRKAFGASSQVLVLQFMVENIFLTLIGGILGVVLSSIIILLFNSSHVIENLHLSINFAVLFYSLLTCLFFGLLSGVYPAWRMSKLNVVTALKG
jgi:putative ABC transport system permease protein